VYVGFDTTQKTLASS